jgi:hypothetical protein
MALASRPLAVPALLRWATTPCWRCRARTRRGSPQTRLPPQWLLAASGPASQTAHQAGLAPHIAHTGHERRRRGVTASLTRPAPTWSRSHSKVTTVLVRLACLLRRHTSAATRQSGISARRGDVHKSTTCAVTSVSATTRLYNAISCAAQRHPHEAIHRVNGQHRARRQTQRADQTEGERRRAPGAAKAHSSHRDDPVAAAPSTCLLRCRNSSCGCTQRRKARGTQTPRDLQVVSVVFSGKRLYDFSDIHTDSDAHAAERNPGRARTHRRERGSARV